MSKREERFNEIVIHDGFTCAERADGQTWLLDMDGENLCPLDARLLPALDDIDNDDVRVVLVQIFSTATRMRERGFDRGKRVGRREIVDTVHELLGIEKLQESFATLEVAMREHGRR